MAAHFLPPESRLLLLAAGPVPDRATLAAHAHAVRSWPAVVARAERERAAGALWRLLAPLAADPAVAEGAAALRRLALVEGFRGQRQRVRLVAALRALAAAGIEVMLIKGAGLATTTYGSFEERAMSDLDVVVRPSQGGAAMAALLASGWRHQDELYPMEMYDGHQHLPPLVDAQHGGVMLEPHTTLFAAGTPFGALEAAVWADARPVQVDGVPALVPSPAHLAVHACLHLVWSHALGSGGWRTLRDLRALTASGHLSWNDFANAAEAAEAAPYCYWPLALARAGGVLDVPDAVLGRLAPTLTRPVRAVLTRHFLLQLFAPEQACPSVRLQRRLWELAVAAPRETGAARPWSRDAAFARFGDHRPAAPLRQRVLGWDRYLRPALTGRTRG